MHRREFCTTKWVCGAPHRYYIRFRDDQMLYLSLRWFGIGWRKKRRMMIDDVTQVYWECRGEFLIPALLFLAGCRDVVQKDASWGVSEFASCVSILEVPEICGVLLWIG